MINTTISKNTSLDLLNEYQAGATFFFASPNCTMLAEGINTIVHQDQIEKIPELIAEVLNDVKQKGHPNPVIVGAFPFDGDKGVKLIVPQEYRIAERLQFDYKSQTQNASFAMEYNMESVPSPQEYMEGVQKGVEAIKKGDLKKIVLSRSLNIVPSEKIDIQKLLYNLALHNKHGYTFAVDLHHSEKTEKNSLSQRTLMGASPELLVSKSGAQVISNPLAGSRPRSKDPIEDKRRADELLSSPKDLHEHAVVIEAVAEALRPYCHTLHVPEKPSLVNSETMWHLSTEIKGELIDNSVSSLELALALHPTPAVCGTPTDKARKAIKKIEPFDREFFTGMLGWNDINGDGEWIVTIRCAEVEDNSLRLFAGAGIVAESRPEDELAETRAKFRTMLGALGLNDESLEGKLEG